MFFNMVEMESTETGSNERKAFSAWGPSYEGGLVWKDTGSGLETCAAKVAVRAVGSTGIVSCGCLRPIRRLSTCHCARGFLVVELNWLM